MCNSCSSKQDASRPAAITAAGAGAMYHKARDTIDTSKRMFPHTHVFSNTIIDRDSINKFNITTCLRAQNTNNVLPEEINLPDGSRFYGFLVKIGWTSDLGEVSFHCGGTLISEKFVLSAAHCMAYERPLYKSQPDIVRIAERLSGGKITGEDIKIANINTHILYGELNMYDDIAIIELEEKSKNQPACIWIGAGLPTSPLFALGHDLRNHGKQQIMSLKLVKSDDCDRRYSPSRKLPNGIIESQFCAGSSNITEGDKCKGHIGGPLLTQLEESSDEVYVVGLTNYGQRCSSTDFPNIYTKISFYKDWILDNVK
ncbi:serine protease snake-like [Eupeodes corollae]|uniref:serine protease snake-like n=1 Tax=Eupeodes corollae TaxID=290404 RepID=UPI002490DD82|nr:serine protease snake-like [Eupeodes corollae]